LTTIIIENVSGADGSIGIGRAARARPTAIRLILRHEHACFQWCFLFASIRRVDDFSPISPLVTLSLVLVARKTMPAKDLAELITG